MALTHPAIESVLAEYSDRLGTRTVVFGRGALDQAHRALSDELDAGLWLLVADANTWRVAGEPVSAALSRAGQPWERLDLSAPTKQGDHSDVVCDDSTIEICKSAAVDCSASSVIAVGSGTINDIVKQSASDLAVPAACIPTAPSMNGYTSAISAVLRDRVKVTQPCRPMRVLIADPDVLATAPLRMMQSGLGDLMSKPVSNADWLISHELVDSPYSPETLKVIRESEDLIAGVAESIPDHDIDAVGRLTAALILSGFAMSIAGSSSPASGGEHLISHYLDMTAVADGIPHDLHGCQVGVGTLATAMIYHRLLSLEPDEIDVGGLTSRLRPWPAYRDELRTRFGSLYDAVLLHAHDGYPSRDQLERRLTKLRQKWTSMRQRLVKELRTPDSLEDELRSAGAPVRFSEIGVDADRARRSILYSKDIRARYTVLHLAWELDILDECAEDIVRTLA